MKSAGKTVKAIAKLFLFVFLAMPSLKAEEVKPLSVSREEKALRERLTGFLGENNYAFEERSLYAVYGGFGSSVFIRIPKNTAGDTNRLFVLAIPLTSSGGPQKNDSYTFDAACSFLKKIEGRERNTDILIAFLGNEVSVLPESERKLANLGLLDLLAGLNSPEQTVLWYLDLDKPPQSLVFHHGKAGAVAPLSILSSIPGLCESLSIPYVFAVRFNALYKLRLAEGPPSLNLALDRGFPALCIQGENRPPAVKDTEADNTADRNIPAETLADLFVDYTVSLNTAAENQDYHYSLIGMPARKVIFVSELLSIVMTLILCAVFFFAFLIYSMIYRRRLTYQWLYFLRHVWLLPVFFVSLALSLEISSGLLIFLRSIFKYPAGYSAGSSYILSFFRLGISLLLFSLISPLTRFLKFPRMENFYGSSAVILVILGILMAAVRDITFVPIFFWAFLFTLLGALVTIPLLIFTSALSTPLLAVFVLKNVLEGNYGYLGEILLSPAPFPVIYMTLISLPFILLLKRGVTLSEIRTKSKSAYPVYFFPRCILLGCLTLFMLVFLYRDTGNTPVPPERRSFTEDPYQEGIISLGAEETVFIERRSILIHIKSKGNPARFDMYMVSEKPFSIYSASVPFESSNNGRTTAFLLGEEPPNPLSAELVVPLDSHFFIQVEAVYNRYDPEIDPYGAPPCDDYILRVVTTLEY
ncbi:MAG: hypothetical protein LBP76_07165 [Treponema sp.]|jgi:hypothetical protein|nr:hypothetical protein [Treponema sp.]